VRRVDHSSRGVLPIVCLIVCDIETITKRRPKLEWGFCAYRQCTYNVIRVQSRVRVTILQLKIGINYSGCVL